MQYLEDSKRIKKGRVKVKKERRKRRKIQKRKEDCYTNAFMKDLVQLLKGGGLKRIKKGKLK